MDQEKAYENKLKNDEANRQDMIKELRDEKNRTEDNKGAYEREAKRQEQMSTNIKNNTVEDKEEDTTEDKEENE